MRVPILISGLTYPGMKVDRAAAHLRELNAIVLKFTTEQPYAISERDDVERQLYAYKVKLNPAPLEIPILIGEFAYSLRSALDHLAWQLGLLSGRTPSRSSAFPIHPSDGETDRERFIRATSDMPSEAVEVIKSLQPYVRGKAMKSDPLWQLNKLCNLDKHQTVGVSHTQVRVWFSGDEKVAQPTADYRAIETTFLLPLAIKDKVIRQPLPPLMIFGKPIEAPGPNFELSQDQIAEIHRYVTQDVIPRFARFFAHLPAYPSE